MVWGARLSKAIAAVAVASAMVILAAGSTEANSAAQGQVVHDDPVDFTPNVLDGHVNAITTVGNKVIVGGTFTMVREAGNPNTFDRDYIFAFDRDSGDIDTSFVPVVDGEVWTLDAAGDGRSVFVGGSFGTVNGVSNFGIAKLDTTTGTMVPGFGTTTAGKVRDLVHHDGKVYLGGDIWSVNGVPRTRMAAIDAVSGAVDSSFTVSTTLPRVSVDWVSKVDISPDGSSLVILGNFLEVDGLPRPQIARIDLTGPTAVVSDWHTDRFAPACNSNFWTYTRDVEFSPPGDYFAVVTTGAHQGGVPDLCDTVSRWESDATGADLLETWADWTGFDTLTAVAVSDVAVYVGGHQKWLNGCEGVSSLCKGAVSREGIGAVDPLNGVPLSWNPGKDRGQAVWDLHLSDAGLYVGSDTDFTAGEYHAKLAQFPLEGGTVPPVPTPVSLPAGLYTGESGTTLTTRTFDGVDFGPDETVGFNVIDWSDVGGVFYQAGKLFYTDSVNGRLNSRPFDGTSMGAETMEPSWVSWENATAAAWADGRLYFTQSNTSELRYRYFSLESGIVSSQTYVASGNGDGLSWSNTRAMAFADGLLFYVTSAGDLYSITMNGVSPVPGTDLLISGPGVDGRDWSGVDLFFFQADLPPTVTVGSPAAGSVVTGASVAVAADATDDFGVTQVEFLAAGTPIGIDTDGADGWSVAWDSTGGPSGSVDVSARATDTIGQTTTDTITVTVDNAPPSVVIDAPSEGGTVSGAVAVLATATDDAAVADVEFFVDGVSIGVDGDGSDGWSVSWDTTSHAGGAATVAAVATDVAGNTAADEVSVTVDNEAAALVAMVVGNPASLNSGESAVIARFQALGYTVNLLDDNGITAGDVSGATFVVVGSSTNSFNIGTSLNGISIPLWVAKPWLFDDVGLTGTASGDFGTTSTSTVLIEDPAHPLAAGFSGSVAFTTGSRSVSYGVPGAGAAVVFSANGLDSLFYYDAGATLANGSTAAGCRFTFPIFQNGPASFTTNAWTLFDASAAFVAGGCVPAAPNDAPVVTITTPAPGSTLSGQVSVAADAGDDQGVDHVEFFANGVSLGIDPDGTDGYSVLWDTTTGSDGATSLDAVATDVTGKTGTDSISVTVDNNPPQVVITSPAAGAVVSGAVVVSADATDAAGVTQVEFLADGVSLGTDTDDTDGWSVTWDTTTGGDGPVLISAEAIDGGGALGSDSVTVTVDNTSAGIVVMVTGSTTLDSGELAVQSRLQTLGYAVTVVDDDVASPGDTVGATLLIVTSTANSNKVGTTYYAAAMPIWVAKPFLMDDMGLTGPAANTDYGTAGTSTVTIQAPGHPLAAGLAGTVGFTTSSKTVSWGEPANDRVVVATAANGRPTIYAYAAGAVLADGTNAAGCRLSFPIFRSGPTFFTATGWALFDAAVAYADAGCA